MTADTDEMAMDIARRVLAEPSSSPDRIKWADDVILWIDFGDISAGKRCGFLTGSLES